MLSNYGLDAFDGFLEPMRNLQAAYEVGRE